MLGFLFGFNARLGRLHYFLATIGLAIVMAAICFVIAGSYIQSTPGVKISSAALMNAWSVWLAGWFFIWMTFMLQSMRIRDIGWDPVCVIPAWIAILIVDRLVAAKIPAWTLGPDYHATVVGGLTSLGLILALMFWPSGDYQGPTYDDAPAKPDRPSPRTDAGSVAAARVARVAGSGFGRRA
jgi:uncharacterized membrane protein YhaH (DUF805 family)